jgi:hypothetical protein
MLRTHNSLATENTDLSLGGGGGYASLVKRCKESTSDNTSSLEVSARLGYAAGSLGEFMDI